MQYKTLKDIVLNIYLHGVLLWVNIDGGSNF